VQLCPTLGEVGVEYNGITEVRKVCSGKREMPVRSNLKQVTAVTVVRLEILGYSCFFQDRSCRFKYIR
jgi:hypothetical protein